MSVGLVVVAGKHTINILLNPRDVYGYSSAFGS